MADKSAYAVYYTAITGEHPVGYVWNRVAWSGDSATWSAPSGSAAVADPDGTYPIGSTYSAS